MRKHTPSFPLSEFDDFLDNENGGNNLSENIEIDEPNKIIEISTEDLL